MSLTAAIRDVVKRIGLILRDLDNRLKEVEMRTTVLYPQVESTFNRAGIPSVIKILRYDNSLACTITNTVRTPPGGSVDSNVDYGNIYNQTTYTFHDLTGAAVTTQTVKPDSNTNGAISQLKK